MHIVRRGVDFPSKAEVDGQAICRAPGILQVRGKLPHTHAEGSIEYIAAGAIHSSQCKIGQGRLRAGATDLASELSVEIKRAAGGESREAIEAMPQEQRAEFDGMGALDSGERRIELKRGAVAVFRKRGVISKLSETGEGEGRYSSRAVVDVDARYSEGGCGIERGIRRCNVRFPADDGKVSLKHRIGIERFGVAQGCRLSYERSCCSICSGGEIRTNRNGGIRGGRYGAGCHLIAVVVAIAEEQTVRGAQVLVQTHVELIRT